MAVTLPAAPTRPTTCQLGTLHKDGIGPDESAWSSVGTSSRVRAKSILVVDDETQIVDFLCLLLEDEGFRAQRAYDGAQAWELIRAGEHPPDLVITDVMMPRLTGLQLLQRLKDSYNGNCPPVIVMSAVSDAWQGPGTRFLPKPFDIDHLLDLVEELTRR